MKASMFLASALASAFLAPDALARPALDLHYVAVKGATQDVEVGRADIVVLELPTLAKTEVEIVSSNLATCDLIAFKVEGGKTYRFYAFEPEIDFGFNGCVAEVKVDGKLAHTVSFGVNVED